MTRDVETLDRAIAIVRAVEARITTDADKARDLRRHARDASGYDTVAYHEGRVDGIDQALRALIEARYRA